MHTSTQTHHKYRRISALLLCLWTTVSIAQQDGSKYLNMLEAEAKNGGAAAETEKTRSQLKINANSTPVQLATSPQSFESILKSRLTATYSVYMKLPPRERLRVYYAYRKSGNFDMVRSFVLEGFKNRR